MNRVLHQVNKQLINISVLHYLTGGNDYVSGPYTVEIPVGQTHLELDVSIVDDNIVEGNEYFILVITPGSLPNKVNPVNPDRTNITIVDNDG